MHSILIRIIIREKSANAHFHQNQILKSYSKILDQRVTSQMFACHFPVEYTRLVTPTKAYFYDKDITF
jgi:hypothetical protein